MCNLAGDDGGRASDRDHGGDGQGQGGGEGGQLHNLGRGINKPAKNGWYFSALHN